MTILLLSSEQLISVLLMLPLIAAMTAILFRQGLLSKLANFVFLSANLGVALCLAALFLSNAKGVSATIGEPLVYQLGGWAAPLGIGLSLTGFALLIMVLTAVLAWVLGIYSLWFFKGEKALRFWPLWWLLLCGLNAIFLSNDAFNIYVCLEVIGLCAAALVALEPKRESLTAALRYLLVGLVGSLFYLLGIALLYRSYGSLDLTILSSQSAGSVLDSLALLLITLGLMLKIALFPLHFWLPPAHANAPAPISALLSSLVVKAGLFVLIRFWFDVLGTSASTAAANVLGGLGAVAIVWGAWQAFYATRLKLMIAYSTVAQLGYLFLLFPLAGSSSDIPAAAATYLIVAHACAKATMFLAAGNIVFALGHDQITRLVGVASQQPLSVLAFAIAGVSLIGLPPSAGFLGKWLLLTASLAAEQWHWFIIVLTGGLLSTLYVFKFLTVAFSVDDQSRDKRPDVRASRVPIALHLSALALATMTIVLGFNSELVLNLGLELPASLEGGD